MCGIAGILEGASAARNSLAAAVARMTAALRHRGPDGGGVWIDAAAGGALGHRRLAVIDTSHDGDQPMVSADGRFVLSFNGEIYNFRELRGELEGQGHRFRSRSDTEVLVEACVAWGVERALARLIGMFAFAVWDRTNRRLVLARDHVGVKPLFWAQCGRRFLFSSELVALAAHPEFPTEIDRDALSAYLRFGYIPAPCTVYRHARKLEPGHFLAVEPGRLPKIQCYWDAAAVARDGLGRREERDPAATLDDLERLLGDAVRRQMMADVPLGAFLSGGTDSSLVVALMQAASPRPVKTFTVGFPERAFDEAPYARAIARHLGTDHTEFYIDAQRALCVVPRVAEVFDEPFADASQIATLLLSELTRREVTVAVSGDGGDELFAGYSHYRLLDRLWRGTRRIPRPIRSAGAWALARIPWQWLERRNRTLPGHVSFAGRATRIAELLSVGDADALYRRRYGHWGRPDDIVLGANEARGAFWRDFSHEVPGFVDRMQLLDQLTYMTDDVLPKVDRTSMAVSLEVRVPLLDHRVVEESWRIPLALKLRDGGKYPLRAILARHVPTTLTDRPKQGFDPPLAAWLRGALRDWADPLIAPERLRGQGLLRPEPIAALWRSFLGGRAGPWDHRRLWDVVLFEAWLEARRTAAAPAPALPPSRAAFAELP